jgi:hypothetical protein
MNKLAVVIIIGYRTTLNENEKLSLRQCYNVLQNWDIRIISPQGMDVTEYKKVNPDIQFEFVHPKWTSSYLMNSQFKTNKWLYSRYRDYEYILFYELDAWVFRDELEYWCKKGWDYIGAPWFDIRTKQTRGSGNGGFSLRRNSSSLRMTNRIAFLKKVRGFWFKSYLQAIIPFETIIRICKTPLHIRKPEDVTSMLLEKEILEDYYWCKKIGVVFNDFSVAPAEISYQFSFEANPGLLFEMNQNSLPFGCHAWEKHEPHFWEKHIGEKAVTTLTIA